MKKFSDYLLGSMVLVGILAFSLGIILGYHPIVIVLSVIFGIQIITHFVSGVIMSIRESKKKENAKLD